jgi:hypothetical protein
VFDADEGGIGHDVISDFDGAVDTLTLANGAAFSIAELGNETVLDLSAWFGHAPGTDVVTLSGVTSFDASDLVFI